MSTQPVRPIRWSSGIESGKAGALLLAASALFVVVGAVVLAITPYPVSLKPGHLVALVGGWSIAWFGSSWLLRRRLGEFDSLLLSVAALLTGWGLIMQARLAPAMLLRQIVWLLLGCGLMCATALTAGLARVLRRYRYTLLTVGILFLGATLVLGVNPSGYGQELWLGAFGLYVQPSEPLKLLLVVYLAAYLSEKRDLSLVRSPGQDDAGPYRLWPVIVGPMLVMVGLALLLLAWQQDLGAALLYYLTFVTMISLAWGKLRYVALSLLLFVPVAVAGYALSSRVALRISIWLDPWAPAQADRAFQILQSLFAFGAGGLGGQGLGEGVPGLIPAVHTDFVFAALVEEFGAIGGIGLVVLFAIYVTRGIRLAQRSASSFESLLAGGISALVCVQTWIITAGNAKLIPITGVTLPFLSYGGSSLVTMLIATGILINLSTAHPLPLALSWGPSQEPPLRKSAATLGQGLMLLLGSVAIVTGFWSLVRAGGLQTYPTNPRYILSEARIRRGRILDRREIVLADIEVDENGYVTRTYPVKEAAPVVGYATIEYGTGGIESACDPRLRGDVDRSAWDDARDELLHVDPVGRDVRLTLDARLQEAAQEELAGLVGAAVLVDARAGDILALASSPSYDPAAIDEMWETLREAPESPLLNRATQGLSQPGTSLQPFILASGWEAGMATAPTGPITVPVAFSGYTVTCQRTPQDSTWPSVLLSGCPAPFVRVAEELGSARFTDGLREWGFLDAPGLTLPTVTADLEGELEDLEQEALGQGQLLVTPLQMVQAIATIGNDGIRPSLHLLEQPYPGCAGSPSAVESDQRVANEETAEQIRTALATYGGTVGHLGTAAAGQERRQAWFAGLNSSSLPRYAVAVLLDNANAPRTAADIGSDLLRLAVELQ